MDYASNQAYCFQLLYLFGDEFLALHGLLSDLLLDGPRMRTNSKLVLNYLPGNAGDVRWLPRKHIDIRPQEGNERAFLFVVKCSTDGEGTTSAVLLGGHLLGCRWSGHSFIKLAGGARWCVLDGSAALRGGAFAGVGPRALAGLGLGLPPGSFSGKCVAFCCGCCIPVYLVGADKRVLLVARDRDDAYRPRHLEYVAGIVGSCHELGEGRTSKYPIVWQWDIGHVEGYPLRPEVELPAKGHWQSNLPLQLAPPRVYFLERTGFFELAVWDLEFLDHSRGDQVQAGPAVNQHFGDLEVADGGRNQHRQAPDRSGAVRVVLKIKNDGRAGPFEEPARLHGRLRCVYLTHPLL